MSEIGDKVRREALEIATRSFDPEWHGEGYPSMVEVVVDLILSISGLAVVDREAKLPQNPWESARAGIPMAWYSAIEDYKKEVLGEGWVQEVKDDTPE